MFVHSSISFTHRKFAMYNFHAHFNVPFRLRTENLFR